MSVAPQPMKVRASTGALGSAGAAANDQPMSPMGASLVASLGGEGLVEASENTSAGLEAEGGKGVTFDALNGDGGAPAAGGENYGQRKASGRFSKLMPRVSSKGGAGEEGGKSLGERQKTWSTLIKRTNSEATVGQDGAPSESTENLTRGESNQGLGEANKSWQRKNTQMKRDLSKLTPEQRRRNPRSIIEMRREPALHMAPYGQFWSMDVFSLPHNAIRRELLDCYIILYAMDVRRLDLTSKDIVTFFQWWTVFVKFFEVFLDAEDDVLYPWVGSAVKLTGLLEAKKRAKIKEHLRMILSLLTNAEPKLVEIVDDGGEPVFLIKRALDKISLLTQEYFVAQERVIPRLLSSVYTLKDKRALDRRFINYLLKSEQAGLNVVLVSRWLQPDIRQPKQLLEWRYDNLGPINWTRYSVWYKQLESKHTRILAFFRAKRDAYLEEEKYKKALQKSDPAEYERRYGTLTPMPEPANLSELVAAENAQAAAAKAENAASVDPAVQKPVESVTEGVANLAASTEEGKTEAPAGETVPGTDSAAGAPVVEDGVVDGVATAAAATNALGENQGLATSGEDGEANVVAKVSADDAAPEVDSALMSPLIPERAATLDGALENYEKRMSAGLHHDNDAVSLRTDDYAESVVLDDALSLVNHESEKQTVMITKRSSSVDAALREVEEQRRVPKSITARAGSSSGIPPVGPAKQPAVPVNPPATARYVMPVELQRILASSQTANDMDLEDFLDADDDLDSVSVTSSKFTGSKRYSEASTVDYSDVW